MSESRSNEAGRGDDVVVRKAERGWVVGEENVSDLTSAMVLADLFAADQAVTPGHRDARGGGRRRRTAPIRPGRPPPGAATPGRCPRWT